MDYVDWVLDYIGALEGFKYHSRCKDMKLVHLCFAYDLLLFCNGDFMSINTMLQGFQMFSHASSLEVNRHKSEVYYAGMSYVEIKRVTNVSGFTCGSLPFKYLGVPISTSKLKARD